MNKYQEKKDLLIVFENGLSWNKSLLLTFHLQNKFDVPQHERTHLINQNV
jgi:hypothetical protein